MMHNDSMDVLTVAGLFVTLGTWAWVFCKMQRVAATDHQTNAACDTPVASSNRDHVVLFNPAAERMVGRGARMPAHPTIATCRSAETEHARRIEPDSAPLANAAGIATCVRAIDASPARAAHPRACAEHNPVATWLMRDGVIVGVNDACLALLGALAPADVIATAASAWLDADGLKGVRRQLAMAPVAPHGRTEPTAGVLTRRDGRTRDVDVLATVSSDAVHAPVLLTFHDVTRRNATERELRESRHALRELARGVQREREAEFARVARELHEGLAQPLDALKIEIAALNARYAQLMQRDGTADEASRKIDAHLDHLAAHVRQLTADLRPPMLDEFGLAATLEWLAQDLFARYGVKIDTDLSATVVDDAAASVLYRIARDALESARLRVPVARIGVQLRQASGFVRLTIREDGALDDAFVDRQRPPALFAIREQVATIGGDADWKTLATGGQELVVHLSSLSRR
ncbi:PAS domain-containing sensor histidine kinase [Burkholderia vietnamiensis]|uniref:PAS domain-containing sensor histidine kinase n=1 Tax=Burkholderia vietnamiensis TaxID=60552 RepID=UPI000755EA11|nr:histidine kinase [Burkholderia vietnamiensis]KVS07275.1 histidine kinase [Burkholderia vietnamiensis]MCA7983769.1 histidine kinase [Burkholderia vietnamiensis]MDN7817000.1 histidine kinase [Burkholderia vietnamiensis]HDR8933791.1 histidine kinase [Burkholderia vietnamiensis]HDR9021160.1 histidine kinase [Burkholderia vietnamiensis]